MSLKDKLKATVQQANEAFEKANADLSALVGEVAVAVKEMTDSTMSAALIRQRLQEAEAPEASLALLKRDGKSWTVLSRLVTYRFTGDGYPISIGNGREKSFFASGTAADREELQAHFERLVTDRESPLVLNVILRLREAGRSSNVARKSDSK